MTDFNRIALEVGFCRTEQLHDLQDSHLTNQIHPVFHPSRFAQTIRYEDLDQVLRLASRFLEVLLPEFFTILCTKPTRNAMTTKTGRPIDWFPEPPAQLTLENDFLAREQLMLLAASVDYGLDTSQDASSMCAASCCAAPDKVAVSSFVRRGMCSTILINHNYLERYVNSYFWRRNDMVRYNFLCIEMASTLVHELAHAAGNLRCNQFLMKPHYLLGRNAKASEEGYEVESRLFGGIIIGRTVFHDRCYVYADGRSSEVNWPIGLVDWPNTFPILSAYGVTNAENLLHPPTMSEAEFEVNFQEVVEAEATRYAQQVMPLSEVIVPAPLPAYTIHWNTDFSHWHQMLQDSFWDVKVKSLGRQAAMWPVKKTGVRWQTRPCTPRIVIDMYNTAVVPEGYYVNFDGLVCKLPTYEDLK